MVSVPYGYRYSKSDKDKTIRPLWMCGIWQDVNALLCRGARGVVHDRETLGKRGNKFTRPSGL